MKRFRELLNTGLMILVIWFVFSLWKGYISISVNIPIDYHLLVLEAMILNIFYDWIKSVKKGG
ncbi:hypothetical protein CN354_28870 [Bacillus cereus]|nr:hypothetical protein CN354_28870 [Bacillus cereus]